MSKVKSEMATRCELALMGKVVPVNSNDEEEKFPAPFEEDYGSGYPSAFCYVFNTESDWCSEFGDAFFEKKSDGYYHRVS